MRREEGGVGEEGRRGGRRGREEGEEQRSILIGSCGAVSLLPGCHRWESRVKVTQETVE